MFDKIPEDKQSRIKEIYRYIRRFKTLDISNIKAKTGLNHATCVRALDEMLERKLIIENGEGKSSGGRRPKLYSINPTKSYTVGVELSNLYTTVLIMDLNLEILYEKKVKMDEISTPYEVLDFIINSIELGVNSLSITKSELLGVGIGVLANPEKTVKENPLNNFFEFKEWSYGDIQEKLEAVLKTKVFVQSATDLALLSEYRQKYWNHSNNLLFVAADLIIRASIIVDGKLLYKTSKETESFGEIIIDPNGIRDIKGRYGTLNSLSSLSFIRSEIIRLSKLGYESTVNSNLENYDDTTFYSVLKGIEEGDELSINVLDYSVRYFAIALSNFILQVRPTHVIIGGTLGARSNFQDRLINLTKERLENHEDLNYDIFSASSNFNSVPIGAGCIVLDFITDENI